MPAPPQEEAAPVPKTELQELQFKAQQCTDDVMKKNRRRGMKVPED